MDEIKSVKSSSLTQSSCSSGTKRKRQSEPKFYAVRTGYKPGVYSTWADCLEQVKGFKKAVFKSFPSLGDAERFVAGEDPSQSGSTGSPPTKYYAVKSGKVPGIYTDWQLVQEQITGWQKPRHRSFSTRAEAQKFIDGDDTSPPNSAVDTTAPKAEGMDSNPGSMTGFFATTHAPAIEAPDGRAPAKKAKKANNATTNHNGWRGALKMQHQQQQAAVDNEADYEAGFGPLPPGSIDGFDKNILLDPRTGQLVYKTPSQRQAIKPVPSSGTTSATDPIRIYTDGSSIGNGRIGAHAGVGVYFGPKDKRNVSEPLPGPRQTNQRAELTALSRALDLAPRNRAIVIVTDSKYAIDCVTDWCYNWRRNGWKTAAGKSVENRDLVEGVLGKVEERERIGSVVTTNGSSSGGIDTGNEAGQKGGRMVRFEWVKGHAEDAGNKEADKLAVEGAKAGKEGSGGGGAEEMGERDW